MKKNTHQAEFAKVVVVVVFVVVIVDVVFVEKHTVFCIERLFMFKFS